MDITKELQQINIKLDRIEQEIAKEERQIKAHPIVFFLLLVVFFIVMDLWTVVARETILRIHPRDSLYFWEYAIIAIIATIFLIWIAKKAGFSLRALENAS